METTEVHAWVGGQIDDDSHGDVTFGVRSGAVRADLYTDTLELAWEPGDDRGRAWLMARGNAFATGLFITPWAGGAPDPDRGLAVAAVGLDGGVIRYLPAGGWTGGRVSARHLVFSPYTEDPDAPPDHGVVRLDGLLGVYRPALQAELALGLDLEARAETVGGEVLQPHVEGAIHWRPDRVVAPIVEGWGAMAEGQSAVTRTRLGGLTPYAVPLAGAAWAEWWVEDYAAARVGVSTGATEMAEARPRVRARGELTADFAAFGDVYGDPEAPAGAVGLRGAGRLTYRKTYTDLSVGTAPWIPRADGLGRLSIFFRVGVDWAPLRTHGET